MLVIVRIWSMLEDCANGMDGHLVKYATMMGVPIRQRREDFAEHIMKRKETKK